MLSGCYRWWFGCVSFFGGVVLSVILRFIVRCCSVFLGVDSV